MSFFPVAPMCLLYSSSSIWLQMFFIRYDYKDGKAERDREKRASRKRRGTCICACRITITITLLEGFIYHQLQLIRLLLRLTTVDLYLDIDSFIHPFTSILVWYVYTLFDFHLSIAMLVNGADEDVTNDWKTDRKIITGVRFFFLTDHHHHHHQIKIFTFVALHFCSPSYKRDTNYSKYKFHHICF